MRDKEVKKRVTIFSIIFLIVIIGIILIISMIKKSDTEYSFTEKNWINANINNVVDISVPGDLSIFNNSGEGVFIDFVEDLEKDTKLSFNIINDNAPYMFKTVDNIDENDIKLFEDYYVIVSKTEKTINSLSELENKSVGVISTDLSKVSDYLNTVTNINYINYANIVELKKVLGVKVDYAIIPLYVYMEEIISGEFKIAYHLDGLNYYYVLSLPNDSSKLNDVITTFKRRWDTNLEKSINYNLLKLYFKINNFTEIQKESIINKDFIVGYIKNLPIEGRINRHFSGLTNVYLNLFSNLTGATFKYVEYSNIEELQKALNQKKVDIALNYYSISNNNYDVSPNLGNIEYVVLADQTNDTILKSLKSLSGKNVKGIENTNLTRYLESKNIQVIKYPTYKKLNKSLKKEDIVIIEKLAYDYFKTSSLSNFNIRLILNEGVTANILLNSDNHIFNEIFEFYISILNNRKIDVIILNSLVKETGTSNLYGFIFNNISYLSILIIAIILLWYIFKKRIKITKKIKKEDKMMYIDVMTNLKNRNYLNDNIEYWESNKVYPQAVIIVDLNNIKGINNEYGHEAGDNEIKAVANILIETQRENSEIIRTNGDEFLIYMVGYEEKYVVTYIHKLNKKFNKLPRGYGASIGYSMIRDEITNMDDAINEAFIMMRKNKVNESEKQD